MSQCNLPTVIIGWRFEAPELRHWSAVCYFPAPYLGATDKSGTQQRPIRKGTCELVPVTKPLVLKLSRLFVLVDKGINLMKRLEMIEKVCRGFGRRRFHSGQSRMGLQQASSLGEAVVQLEKQSENQWAADPAGFQESPWRCLLAPWAALLVGTFQVAHAAAIWTPES